MPKIDKLRPEPEETKRIIKNISPPMTESERMKVKQEIERKLYEIFRKYY